MGTFNIKVGDTRPAIQHTLKDRDGTQIPESDLSNANAVRFHMREVGADTTVIDAAATVVDASEALVEYKWTSGDTGSPGEFEAEFEVEYSDGNIETFPNTDYIEVKIREGLA